MIEILGIISTVLSLIPAREIVTVTWYVGPGPNTSCGFAFDPAIVAAAAPLDSKFECGDIVTLCTDRCAAVVVWDRIPKHSSDRYGGKVFDLTPAAMTQLNIPHGYTDGGLAYGRSEAFVFYP